MKKVFLSVAIVATLVLSCKKANPNGNSDRISITKEEYNQLRNNTAEYPKHFDLIGYSGFEGYDNAIIMGSDGHEYLITRSGYGNESQNHYVECKKCVAEKERLESLLMEIIRNTSKNSTSVAR